jgi:competence ComEA-like helix-hairpin-helix protein
MMRSNASILVALLWCLALLSLAVMGVLHTARLDLLVVKNHGDSIQAHYLALAGVEKAKALLYHDAKSRSRSRQSHTGELFNAPQEFRDVVFGRGHFQVIRRGRSDEGGGIIYGVSDEESRINLNAATPEVLARLDGITPGVVAAIMDWRDYDNAVSPGGAEQEAYLSQPRPSLPRNAMFQTVRELLMVSGVSPEFALGQDRDQNGLLNSDRGEEGSSTSQEEVLENAGWSALLTVNSSVRNLNAAGEKRINVQTANEHALSGIKGITPEIARAIIAYRAQTELKNLADLLDVTASAGQNQPRSGNSPAGRMSRPGNGSGGPKVISEMLLMDIGDDVTASESADVVGAVNINTASLNVLACLPGLNRDLAQAIISYRRSSGFFPNSAWLLKVPGISRDIFSQLSPLITTRSETFRIMSEGRVDSTGARRRVEVIVSVENRDIQTLSYREDL